MRRSSFSESGMGSKRATMGSTPLRSLGKTRRRQELVKGWCQPRGAAA